MITNHAKPYGSFDQSAGQRSKAFGWLPATALALTVALAAQSGSAQPVPLEWSELRVLVEINATDGDAGFQAKMDAVGWKEVRIPLRGRKSNFSRKGTPSWKTIRTLRLWKPIGTSIDIVLDDVRLENQPGR